MDRCFTALLGGVALALSAQVFAGERKDGMQVGAMILASCRVSVQSVTDVASPQARDRALSVACPRQTAFQVMTDSRASGYPPRGLASTPFVAQGLAPEVVHLATPVLEAGGANVQRVTIEY